MVNKEMEAWGSKESTHTLGDFVRHVAAELTRTNGGFPYEYDYDEAWQRMLFYISKKYNGIEPFSSTKLIFEYDDAEYPVCPQMSEYMDELGFLGAIDTDVQRGMGRLNRYVAELWERELQNQDKEYQKIIREASAWLTAYVRKNE